MKRVQLLVAFCFSVLLSSTSIAADIDLIAPDPDAAESVWIAFGDNLVMALKTDNEGLNISALHHIARYGERVDVRDARFEMVRIFRDHEDSRVRMLALAALSKAKDAWIADFLRRSARYEKDHHLASLMYHAALANVRS